MIKLVLLFSALCFSNQTSACRFSPDYSPEKLGALAIEAPYVVDATLVSTSSTTAGRFRVHKWLKGSGSSQIEIAGFGHGTDCRSPMYTSRSILFLTKGKNGVHELREFSTYSGMHETTAAALQAINAALDALRKRKD